MSKFSVSFVLMRLLFVFAMPCVRCPMSDVHFPCCLNCVRRQFGINTWLPFVTYTPRLSMMLVPSDCQGQLQISSYKFHFIEVLLALN